MNESRKNVLLLSACQALLFAHSATLVAVAGLAGRTLAVEKSLATLPLTATVVGAAAVALPASLLMRRIGRRAGFALGAAGGLLGVILFATALRAGSFWLLCLGMLLFGVYGGFAQYYRFAAADSAPPTFKSKAISLVLAGGLAGGLIGPEISKLTAALHPVRFLGTAIPLAVYLLLVLALLTRLRIPPLTEEEQHSRPRELRVIAAQPDFIVAVLGAALGFGVMSVLMVATPLAMDAHGHTYAAAALVIQWHFVAMFAPSFVTGSLIRRFGVLEVMLAGAAALGISIAIARSDTSVPHFWFSLVLLGIGWNFLYIGGTTLLTESYRPAERAKTQGVNDFIVLATQAVASLASGWLLESGGWTMVNYLAVPPVIVMGLAIGWLMSRRRRGELPA